MAYALVKGNDSGLIKSDSSETPHSVRTTAGPGLLRPFHLKLGKDCGHLVLPGAFGCGFSDLFFRCLGEQHYQKKRRDFS